MPRLWHFLLEYGSYPEHDARRFPGDSGSGKDNPIETDALRCKDDKSCSQRVAKDIKRLIPRSQVPRGIEDKSKPVLTRGSSEILACRPASGKAWRVDIEASLIKVAGGAHQLPWVACIAMDEKHCLICPLLMGKGEWTPGLARRCPILIDPFMPG